MSNQWVFCGYWMRGKKAVISSRGDATSHRRWLNQFGKNMFFDDLRQKDVIRILQYVTTHTIIHGTGIWISACFFMKTKHFSGSGVLYHSHGWWFMRLTFLFSFGHQPNRPPPGFFVSPSAIVYLLMINVRGAQVPKFFSWFQCLAKWWKIGMCFFQVGPYGRYKWGQKSPINDLYKWIAGVITPYNNNPCKWSSFTLLAYRRNAHRK